MVCAVTTSSIFAHIAMDFIERGTVVVLTHNRRARLTQTLRELIRLPGGWPIIVVDNGSTDGTAKAVAQEFPTVMLIRSRRNIGAAARNIAVAYVHTPYVAFCDDDMQWRTGSLQRAAKVLDDYPKVAVVSGCVLDAETGRVDTACADMARSPLDREDLPGPQILGFLTSACVVRARAFYEAGGFWPPLFSGGEDTLLALDMAERGWRMVYLEDMLAQRVSCARDASRRKERSQLRNAIWVAWMRLPLRQAWRETRTQLRKAASRRELKVVVMQALTGMTRVLKRRHVISPRVAAMWDRFHAHTVSAAPESTSATRSSLV